jgi:hypothetical protein
MDIAPSDSFEFAKGKGNVLLIACGALGREIIDLIEANRWPAFDVTCLPAKWHNEPHLIPDGVREKIRANKDKYRKIYILYGDCGTGGLLDKVLKEEGVERIEGPHCYSFFSGNDAFAERSEDDMRALFLTDYFARHFDKLIWQGFGLDRRPDMVDFLFENYEKVVYLAQAPTPDLEAKARAAADRLKLSYEFRPTGYGDLARFMAGAVPPASSVR